VVVAEFGDGGGVIGGRESPWKKGEKRKEVYEKRAGRSENGAVAGKSAKNHEVGEVWGCRIKGNLHIATTTRVRHRLKRE